MLVGTEREGLGHVRFYIAQYCVYRRFTHAELFCKLPDAPMCRVFRFFMTGRLANLVFERLRLRLIAAHFAPPWSLLRKPLYGPASFQRNATS